MNKEVWAVVSMIIGQELDDLFYNKAVEQGKYIDNDVTINKKDLDKMYFKIKEKVARNIVIE